MCSFKNDNLPEPDILQVNMDTIAKELNDLIVAGEKEFGMNQRIQQQQQQPNVGNTPTPKDHLMQINQMPITPYMMQYYPNSEQLMMATAAGMQNVATPNTNYVPTYQQAPLGATSAPIAKFVPYNYYYTPQTYVNSSQNVSYSNLRSQYATPSAVESPPEYEFHYLRPQAEKIKAGGSSQFYSNTIKDEFGNRSNMGAFRKYQKPLNKHYHSHKMLNEGLDYDKIVVDLSVLGWSNDGKEINPVLRLFALFRDLYNATAEEPPSFEPLYDSEYEPTFAHLPKCNMPCTMNVQYQVKQACRKVTNFLCDMQRILTVNKMYDRNLNAECEQYLNNLRQLLTQFESYKRFELEHKRGQFINEEVKVHAERLEHLLEHINRQIREVNIRITAYDWFIGVQHRGQVRKASCSTSLPIDGTPNKKSKIGVINEILQMCNISMEKTATTTETAIKSSIAISKSLSEINNNENNNKSMVNVKPKINKNKDNLFTFASTSAAGPNTAPANVTACLQTTSAAVNLNLRQPVFYIG